MLVEMLCTISLQKCLFIDIYCDFFCFVFVKLLMHMLKWVLMITLDYSAEKRADLYRKAGCSFLFYFFFFVIYVDLRVKKMLLSQPFSGYL